MDETILVNYLQGECNDEEAARKDRKTGKLWSNFITLFL